jgi:hypothetical protein
MYLKNPDRGNNGNPIYGVWHFCKVCGKVYTHSQGAMDSIKSYACCRANLENVSTKNDLQPVCIIEADYETEKPNGNITKHSGLVLSKVEYPNQ